VSDAWGDPDPERVWRPETTPPPIDQPPAYYPPPGTYVDWQPPPPPPPLKDRARETAVTIGGTVAVLVLLGAPVAFLWGLFAPVAAIAHTASGPQPVAPESSQLFAVDGWFAVVTLFAGAICGAVAWPVLRRRGPAAPVGLALGGTLAAFVTSAVGRRVVIDHYLYTFCHAKGARCLVYSGALHLHAVAAVVVWPVAMLAVFAALTLVNDRAAPPR
jgi:hypothetical protein